MIKFLKDIFGNTTVTAPKEETVAQVIADLTKRFDTIAENQWSIVDRNNHAIETLVAKRDCAQHEADKAFKASNKFKELFAE